VVNVHKKSNEKMKKREWLQLGGYFLEFLKVGDLITWLFSSLQNSEGGGDSDSGESFADPPPPHFYHFRRP
jgi:hypothetical protein